MDIGNAEVGKSETKHWGGGESSIEGAELSIRGAEGHPKSIQIDTSVYYYVRKFVVNKKQLPTIGMTQKHYAQCYVNNTVWSPHNESSRR